MKFITLTLMPLPQNPNVKDKIVIKAADIREFGTLPGQAVNKGSWVNTKQGASYHVLESIKELISLLEQS